jgi:hypothetical protein
MLRMLTSNSLSAFSVTPSVGAPTPGTRTAGADPIQRTRAPGSGREEPPPTPPSNAAPPGGGVRPPEPGSRVLPRGSLVDLSV